MQGKRGTMIGIGIDTGGTYTDGVVYDISKGEVLAKGKALTTKEDLSIGIGNVLDGLPADKVRLAETVSLSTTLATNACVEGKGGRAKLILVGTTDEILHRVDAQRKYGIPYKDTLAIDFTGTFDGTEVTLPDWEQLEADNPEFFADAEAFGIAGVYALNNGAAVEKSAYEYLTRRYPDRPVVMATTVATATNMMERGATALLNARLIPVVRDFMDAVKRALAERGLDLPVMIVRSDGSLMGEELALVRPVETILSGPAASVSGARSMSDAAEALVIDIGGTTSDIAVVHDGKPVMTDGIRIGGWKTQIGGVSIDTIGLGGDSEVCFDRLGGLTLSPRRVEPMCVAARRWPKIKNGLAYYLSTAHPNLNANYEFLYLVRSPRPSESFSAAERELIDVLKDGPVGVFDDRIDSYRLDTGRLESEGVVMRVGLTPTDAMHLRGDFDAFDAEASYLAVRCLLRSLKHDEAMSEQEAVDWVAGIIYELAEHKLYDQVARVLIQDRYPKLAETGLGEQLELVMADAWKRFRAGTPARSFDIDLSTASTLVGIGAPTHILLPMVAEALHTGCVIPPDHEVANAIGAIRAEIVVDDRAWVTPNRGGDGVVKGYIVHSSETSETFEDLDEAMRAARAEAERVACAEARRRGAIGKLYCEVDENERSATGGDGVVVTLQWDFDAHVRTSAISE